MAYLTSAQTDRLARMAGEYHKETADRMVNNARLDEIAGEVALLKDSEGVVPGGDDYVTTVDIYRAAAESWREKAGMVADGYDFESEGASFTRSQLYDNYVQQAARYAALAGNLTMAVGRPVEEEIDADAFEEWLEAGGGLP